MTRFWLLVFTGPLVWLAAADLASGQQAAPRPTLAERMAALSRGWTGGNTPPAQPANAGAARSGEPNRAARGASDPHRAGGVFPQIEARSLLPGGLFGREEDADPTRESGGPSTAGRMPAQPPHASTRQAFSDTPGEAIHTAARPREGSVQARESFHDGFTLPGLGGSPLPPSAGAAFGDMVTDEPAESQPEDATRDYPVILPDGRVEGRSPLTPAASSISADEEGRPNFRRSPERHAPIQVDPEILRRELAGSFPATSDAAKTTSASDDGEITNPAPLPVSLPVSTPTLARPSNAAEPEIADESSGAGETAAKPLEQQSTTNDEASSVTPIYSEHDRAASDRAASGGPARDAAEAFGASPAPRQPVENGLRPSPFISSPATAPDSTRRREAFGELGQSTSAEPGVLVSHQTPVITTDIRGPQQIMIGREATYRVRLRNESNFSAEGIVAHVRIPSWADVIDTATTHGTIQNSQNAQAAGLLEWQLAQLDANSTETLDIQLVPRTSRPLELGVSWTLAPMGSRAVVEVQEPKLGMHVSGPDEVLYGKAQLYRLTLTNPGTGAAENVQIALMPPGGGEDAVTTHAIGDLPAGGSKNVEVELTAREAGKLSVRATATADGGLWSQALKEIFCRKPELEVDWRGPQEKFSGTEATYYFRVRNPGTAVAEDVTVRVGLPQGAKLVSASEGQQFDAQRHEVEWRVGSLGPGDDYYMELKCLVNSAGPNQFRIGAATAVGELSDSKTAETNVIALADLKLEVSDPPGAIAVGDEAVYEIRVQNRGANTAKDINIVALFSDGIEPATVEGAMYTAADGRVTFRTVEELAAGRQLVLRIRAHAVRPGTHVFRAEVLCRELDIKLAAEETTRFYGEDVLQSSSDSSAADSGSAGQGFEIR